MVTSLKIKETLSSLVDKDKSILICILNGGSYSSTSKTSVQLPKFENAAAFLVQLVILILLQSFKKGRQTFLLFLRCIGLHKESRSNNLDVKFLFIVD